MGQSRPDDQTRKVSWEMVRRSSKAAQGERVLQVSTKCRSVDELVVRFAPFAKDDSLAVPARPGMVLGERLILKVNLADQTEVFSARGEVVEIKEAGQGASDSRPVVRIKLLEMDETNQALFLAITRPPPPPRSLDNERTVVPSGEEVTDLDQLLVTPPPVLLPPAPFRRAAVPPPQRAAGSEYKLPANPLAELNLDAVRSFIDCNLYESEPDAAFEEDKRKPSALQSLSGESRWQRFWLAVQRLADKLPSPLQRTFVQAMPFAFCTLLGWCVGFNMAGPSKGIVPTTPLAAPSAGGATAKELPRAPVVAIEAPAEPIAPSAPAQVSAGVPPSDAPEVHAPPACSARIQVQPAGVTVKWGGQVLGETPLPQTAVPCGPSRLVLERERWETVFRPVNAVAGVPVLLSLTMARPVSLLMVSTNPSGADIEIDGQSVGKSPKKVSLRRYRTVKVSLRLDGHRSWHSDVALRVAALKLDAKLDPLPKPKTGAKAAKP